MSDKKESPIYIDIEGMTCGSCVSKVERLLKEVKGVDNVAVDLKNKKAKVKFETDTPSKEELIKVIEAAGFKASIPA